MKFLQIPCLLVCVALTVAGCGGGTKASLSSATQSPVITSLTAKIESANTYTLTATATDGTGITGYCFKTVDSAPLANDACFQTAAQITGAALAPGVTHYVWAKNSAGKVSASFKGPCSNAGYTASDSSGKSTVCMLTDKGEIVLELDAAKAPISVANFLKYTNDGFYSDTTFHRVIPNFMIQGGGDTYTSATGYQLKPSTYPAIALEKTSVTGLSNIRGSIAMARTFLPDSATNQFFINVVDNSSFLDSATAPDTYGYAVFGNIISGLTVADQVRYVPVSSPGVLDQPITPIFIQWAYQLK